MSTEPNGPAGPATIELSARELREIAGYAADCAFGVLALFEESVPGDPRPREAIDAARAFAAGGRRTAALRQSAWAAYRAAREAASPAAAEAARAASHAAGAAFLHPRASAHQVRHILGAAAHAIRAEELAATDAANARAGAPGATATTGRNTRAGTAEAAAANAPTARLGAREPAAADSADARIGAADATATDARDARAVEPVAADRPDVRAAGPAATDDLPVARAAGPVADGRGSVGRGVPAAVAVVLGRLPGAPAGGGRVGAIMRDLDAALRG
ncbi:putative immunity protein [Streptomyces sp. NPDC028722]|uniref:putative immunity protein n=1 Tax=Streptomyces sp. NPDC028722 TaxID=3155016 RepID=UPI003407A355